MKQSANPVCKRIKQKGGCCMEDKKLVDRLKQLKEEKRYTLHDLSRKLDIQVTTIERWFKTKRINKLYASVINERMKTL